MVAHGLLRHLKAMGSLGRWEDVGWEITEENNTIRTSRNMSCWEAWKPGNQVNSVTQNILVTQNSLIFKKNKNKKSRDTLYTVERNWRDGKMLIKLMWNEVIMFYLKLTPNIYAETEENLKEHRRFCKGYSNPWAPEHESEALVATSLQWVGITMLT